MKKKTLFALLSLLFLPLGLKAQNVTIRPDNGNLIVGQAGGQATESGIKRGLFAMWRHEQLPLTMTTSDLGLQTSAGEIGDPSCGIGTYNGKLILAAGQTQTFVVVSLPKGYRITSYRLVLQPDLLDKDVKGPHGEYDEFVLTHRTGNGTGTTTTGGGPNPQRTYGAMAFYETPAWESASPYGENTHSLQLNCPDAITAATAQDGDQTMNPDVDAAKEFIIERTSQSADDMSNQLHFFFARSCSQYGITIKSFEIWFNAQGTFDAGVSPVAIGEATDYVTSPFTTGKMDVGAIVEDDNGIYTYDYTKVRDLIAYTHLYQDNAISGGKPAHIATGEKNIYPLEIDGKYAFAFKNDTYYIESPTEISTVTGISGQPIGFRIVGAKFDYQWGTTTPARDKIVPTTCQITCKGSNTTGQYAGNPASLSNNGNTTFYLNSYLMFTTTPFTWEMDDLGNIGIGLDTDYPQYLACFGEGETRQLSLSSSADRNGEGRWNLTRADDGSLYYYSDGGNSYRLYARRFQEGTPYHTRGLVTRGALPTNLPNGEAAVWVSSTTAADQTIQIPAFTPGAYTLTVYDKTGTQLAKQANGDDAVFEVNNASETGTFELSGLNNDAVRFEISGLTGDALALVRVTLQMEALSPYIDKMDIVCHDAKNPTTGKPNLELTQTFTASDFSVSGGKFIFYVPTDYKDVPLTFTFSSLYSKYGDNTYYTGLPEQKDGNSRYSYVTSDYFEDFDGNGDGGLYDLSYTPNSDYMDKVFTSTAGNVRFKFNNAENLGKPASEGGETYLKEEAFSVAKYLDHYKDPDWKSNSGTTQEEGAFIPCILIANTNASPAGTNYQKSDIFYVFTADETRYNIAPTTEWQHRSYAFYRMDIELEARTFTPKFTYTKIYDKTLQLHEQVNKETNAVEEIELEDSMWGLTLDAEEELDEVTGEQIIGYFTYQEIIDHILGRGEPEDGDYIPSTLDPNNSVAPKYMRQILYVDGTPLSAMLNSSENSIVKRLSDLKDSLAVNNIVFLPVNTTSTLDNSAFKTSSGGFRAGKDIILNDKQPFYTPYNIQVDAANYATHTRKITVPANDKVVNATVMLPFTLTTDASGKHTNPTGENIPGSGLSFTVNQLGSAQIVKKTGSGPHDYGTAYFEGISGPTTEANKPYMIMVTDAPSSSEVSFIATQKGSLIVKTPVSSLISPTLETQGKPQAQVQTEANNNGYRFTGELIKGTETEGVRFGDDSHTVNFTNYASYSGNKFTHANPNIFYFTKDEYVNMNDLVSYLDLCVYPFRGFYAYTSANSREFKLKRFDISYEKPESEVTAIDDAWKSKADLMIRSDKGCMTLTATRAQEVTIYSASGVCIAKVNMQGGDTQTVNMPSGVYVVNNVKIGVK